VIGDNEGSRRLGESAVQAWSQPTNQPDIGPNCELTLLATRHLANALLSLGIKERARSLAGSALERLRNNPQFGPDQANLARDQYGQGQYAEALVLQEGILPTYRQVMPNPKHPVIL
jgi:hypothetical protein